MVCSTSFTADTTSSQKYDMLVMYKPGKSIPVADVLSRTYLNETDSTSELMEAHVHLIVSSLSVSAQKLKDIKDAGQAEIDGWMARFEKVMFSCHTGILESSR